MTVRSFTRAQRARAEEQDPTTWFVRAHCGVCAARFMGDERVAVVLDSGEQAVVHVACFDARRMDVA